MTTRELNQMIKDASSQNENVYAKGLEINTIGLTSDQWIRVIKAQWLRGALHVRVLQQSRPIMRVLDSTIFDIR